MPVTTKYYTRVNSEMNIKNVAYVSGQTVRFLNPNFLAFPQK